MQKSISIYRNAHYIQKSISIYRNAHYVQKSIYCSANLKQWHQAYHFFRRSVHCFVNGIECQMNAQFHEALDHYTEAYNYTVKANSVPVTVSFSIPFRSS